MDRISIVELQRALEPVLGLMGARQQILGALRRNELKSSCDEFVGVNASDYSVTYPSPRQSAYSNSSNARNPTLMLKKRSSSASPFEIG